MEDAERETDRARVLIVDDEPLILSPLKRTLERAGYEVRAVEAARIALELADTEHFEAALVDLRMPDMDGLELVEALKQRQPDVEVVMMTGFGTVEDAFRAVQLGAYDFLQKPFQSLQEVLHVVGLAVERQRLLKRNRFLEERLDAATFEDEVVARSAKMRELMDLVGRVAGVDAPALIRGEEGTGRRLLAQMIHQQSPNKQGRFVSVTCRGLEPEWIEADLFGKDPSSRRRNAEPSAVERAAGGTLFIDEVTELPASAQLRLVGILERQDDESRPRELPRLRLIASTAVDVEAAVRARRLRRDLYYRLNVIRIDVPPLRERLEDLPLLTGQLLERYAERTKKSFEGVTPDALEALARYAWPGNVRELATVIESAVLMSSGPMIGRADLRPDLRQGSYETEDSDLFHASLAALPLTEARARALERFERGYLRAVLRRTGGNIAEAARLAGTDRKNFRRVLARHRDAFEDLLANE